MRELIRQAFDHVEVLGPQVLEGRYDLVGPNGAIILPKVWDTMIEPGWAITMHMWPLPEPPPPPPPRANWQGGPPSPRTLPPGMPNSLIMDLSNRERPRSRPNLRSDSQKNILSGMAGSENKSTETLVKKKSKLRQWMKKSLFKGRKSKYIPTQSKSIITYIQIQIQI